MATKKKATKKTVKHKTKVIKSYKSKIIAQWYKKQFYISRKEMNTFQNLSIKHSYATETKENKKKMPKVKNKNIENGDISLEVPLNVAWCKNVRTEYKWWKDQCLKARRSLLYIGSSALSGNNYLLKSVEVSDITITNTGTWVSCVLSLTFIECPYQGTAAQKKKTIKKLNMGKKTRTTTIKKVWDKKKKKYVKKTSITFNKNKKK